jgi:hypothetical protein
MVTTVSLVSFLYRLSAAVLLERSWAWSGSGDNVWPARAQMLSSLRELLALSWRVLCSSMIRPLAGVSLRMWSQVSAS